MKKMDKIQIIFKTALYMVILLGGYAIYYLVGNDFISNLILIIAISFMMAIVEEDIKTR